jgi:hypothetical protein
MASGPVTTGINAAWAGERGRGARQPEGGRLRRGRWRAQAARVRAGTGGGGVDSGRSSEYVAPLGCASSAPGGVRAPAPLAGRGHPSDLPPGGIPPGSSGRGERIGQPRAAARGCARAFT